MERRSNVGRNDRRSTELLSFPEIQRRYGIGLVTLKREASRGSFPVYEAGTPRRPRVRRSEFEEWVSTTRIPQRGQDDRLPPAELERQIQIGFRFLTERSPGTGLAFWLDGKDFHPLDRAFIKSGIDEELASLKREPGE